MSIEHKSRSLKELYEKIENRAIVLPNFQRGFVWSIEQQKKLLASTVVRIPIGSTLHLKGHNNAFSARALCERSPVTPSVQECEYVLDGQQRLSTLKNAFYDIYDRNDWSNTWDNLFSTLRVRWYFTLNTEYDIFGLETLNFDANYILQLEPRAFFDSITYKKIFKKDTDEWYHPGYIPEDSNGNIIIGSNEQRLHIAELALLENLVPLYEVYLGNDGIHNKVIEMFSRKQVELLKTRARDEKEQGEEGYKEFIVKHLVSVESNISQIIDKLNQSQIDTLFDELGKKWSQKFDEFMSNLPNIDMPIILLEQKEAGRAAAIFEEMNNGGTALSIYDLIVAKAATADSSQVSLTDKIIEQLKSKIDNPFLDNWSAICMTSVKDNMLSKTFQSTYLNSLAILVAKTKDDEVIDKSTISRNYVLDLSAEEITNHNNRVISAIIRTYAFLQFYCGVINEKNIIYDYMILPLIYFLDDNEIWENKKKLNILKAWYFSWLFSGKYKERQDDQFIKDIDYLTRILKDPSLIKNEDFLSDRLLNTPDYSDEVTLMHENDATEHTAPKAMKDAILQYILSRQPQDLSPTETIILTAYDASCNDEKVLGKNCKKYKLQIHHIIPLGTVTKIGEVTEDVRKDKTHILNSPLNLTYISECANVAISDKEYSEYKKEIASKCATHLLTLEDFSSKNDINKILKNRYVQLKTTLNAEIAQLIN